PFRRAFKPMNDERRRAVGAVRSPVAIGDDAHARLRLKFSPLAGLFENGKSARTLGPDDGHHMGVAKQPRRDKWAAGRPPRELFKNPYTQNLACVHLSAR